MPIAFPLPLSSFFDALPIKSVSLPPFHNNQASMTRGGEFIVAYNGPTLWRGTVTLGRQYNEDAFETHALLSLAQQYDASFIAYHPAYKGPRRQPGVASGKLGAAITNGREIQITGLPSGYVLAGGDRLSWIYGTSPVRYAYHSVVFDSTANTSGTITVEVQPMLKPGALVAGAAIELIKPRLKAKIIPGSVKIGEDHSIISEGSSFEFQQVIGE